MEHTNRNGRDAAGVGPYARERENLVALSTLGSWKVSEGEPDIRSWEVRTVSGRQLGSVHDLLIDPNAGEVVMLDVDLPGTDHHTFVPIRVVQIDRTRRIILMDSADLPESDLTRASPDVVASEPRDARVVRYPESDREVSMERPQVADDVVVREDELPPRSASPIDAATAAERRRAERRHIDRLSTDI
jgi:sporulation protein YlmC with PRC-barrel domain